MSQRCRLYTTVVRFSAVLSPATYYCCLFFLQSGHLSFLEAPLKKMFQLSLSVQGSFFSFSFFICHMWCDGSLMQQCIQYSTSVKADQYKNNYVFLYNKEPSYVGQKQFKCSKTLGYQNDSIKLASPTLNSLILVNVLSISRWEGRLG